MQKPFLFSVYQRLTCLLLYSLRLPFEFLLRLFMYRISQVADRVGLSRTALLYYEKLGLINGERLTNGYRVYRDIDIQRIKLVQQLQAGGLSLKECKASIEAKIDLQVLQLRLDQLEAEIAEKQQSRELLLAMLGKGDERTWHANMDKVAPDAHLEFLMKQGFTEKEALRLKWLSKDMTEHDKYMQDFMKIFSTLERWGPGSEEETLKALSLLPQTPKQVLEIGPGKGLSTAIIAQQTGAHITAVDNEQSALDKLATSLQEKGLSEQVTPLCASMTDLPLEPKSYDLIWAEGCAYIMGVEKALAAWNPFLKDNGTMMLSDAVWLTDTQSEAAHTFWTREYPDIQPLQTRLNQIEQAGYNVIAHFSLSQASWENYYLPVKQRALDLQAQMPDSQAIKDTLVEMDIFEKYLGEFGYQMFILAKA